MIVVYEFENGEMLITDGTVDEKKFHMNVSFAKKTVYENGVVITTDLKVEEIL